MRKIRNNILLKIFLISLYIAFYIGNTAFIHTHHYSYYSVTHSHPFSKAADGTPDHTHNKIAIDTIAQLNSFAINIIPFLILGIISILFFTFVRQHRFDIVRRVVESYNLRAPPVL